MGNIDQESINFGDVLAYSLKKAKNLRIYLKKDINIQPQLLKGTAAVIHMFSF